MDPKGTMSYQRGGISVCPWGQGLPVKFPSSNDKCTVVLRDKRVVSFGAAAEKKIVNRGGRVKGYEIVNESPEAPGFMMEKWRRFGQE